MNEGTQYEAHARRWLESNGFSILDRNWRNRFCEIDIVAQKEERVHIVEVKYRGSDLYGKGYEHVDAKKQQRLLRAAQAWVQSASRGGDAQIDVISIDGVQDKLTYIASAIGADNLH